jgi:calmodulin
MVTKQGSEVILVPPDKRLALLHQADDVFVQSEDGDSWLRPSKDTEDLLKDYLNDSYGGAPKRFWVVRAGTRVGYNAEGVFIHENHHKSYFGIETQKANMALRHGVTQSVPYVNAKGEKIMQGTKTEQLLGKMLHHLPTISDDMRFKVLHACFTQADRNNNKKLSRPELGLVLRRVINTLRTEDIENILRDADVDGDMLLDYSEFVAMLQKSSNQKISLGLCHSLRNEADVVRATFRLWDMNGDGLVPNLHLCKALAKVHPDFQHSQIKALVHCMDCDHDGNVDYDEFVDFLFQKRG